MNWNKKHFTFWKWRTHVHECNAPFNLSVPGSADLLLCAAQGRQLVQLDVVLCSDGGQPAGGGHGQQVGQTEWSRVLLLLLVLAVGGRRGWGGGHDLVVDAAALEEEEEGRGGSEAGTHMPVLYFVVSWWKQQPYKLTTTMRNLLSLNSEKKINKLNYLLVSVFFNHFPRL